jgi:hypothetical protein
MSKKRRRAGEMCKLRDRSHVRDDEREERDHSAVPQRLCVLVMKDGWVSLSIEQVGFERFGNIITHEDTLRALVRWLECR